MFVSVYSVGELLRYSTTVTWDNKWEEATGTKEASFQLEMFHRIYEYLQQYLNIFLILSLVWVQRKPSCMPLRFLLLLLLLYFRLGYI